jgi:hypothetical protein
MRYKRGKGLVFRSICRRPAGRKSTSIHSRQHSHRSLKSRHRKGPKNANIVLFQECFRVRIAIDADLGNSIVDRWLLMTLLNPDFEPWQDDLEPIALLDLIYKLVHRDRSRDRGQQPLDSCLVAVHIQQTSDNLGRSRRVDTLDINLDKVRQAVLVKVQDEVVDEIETVADNDERQLIRELGLLEEILDFVGIVIVALAANALHLADLAGTSGSLDVFEMHFRVLAEVDDRSKVVVQP